MRDTKHALLRLKAQFAAEFLNLDDNVDVSMPIGCDTCGDSLRGMSLESINRVIDTFAENLP